MAGKIFVVTGANKGIGFGIVRGLAQQLHGATIYLTARTPCADFATFLNKTHGGLDVLINNAGFAFKQNATESAGVQADVTIGINYYGTKLISDHLAPLIRAGGRIVNSLTELFSRGDFTLDDITNFVEEYKKLAHADNRKQGGYPESAYSVSKTAEIALTLVQARELARRNIVVNACCPGYVDTDMTSHKGHRTIAQGAETPIFLAIDETAIVRDEEYQNKQQQTIDQLTEKQKETTGLFVDSAADLFPCVTLFLPGAQIQANFGPDFFKIADRI
uniref:Carbonyl reductase n=1 Tax=Globodera rostochiensis TaxID=31243 RepID=A0A914HW60_GLORO